MKILASAADDKTIKQWRLSRNKHWQMDTLRSHMNNVSYVMFHPRMELLISNSENRTLRVRDMQRRILIHTTRKDTDRYWIFVAHLTLIYFAAVYDNGINLFKLERERYSSFRVGSQIFYFHYSRMMAYDISTKKTNLLKITTNSQQVLLNQPSVIYYNSFKQNTHDVLINYDIKGGQFELLEFDKVLNKAAHLMERCTQNVLSVIFLQKRSYYYD